ncbi:cytochrome P450 CYP82D47-like [Cucurbita pepo subsp. pepo]|uniref:cytochrome P450 CYP82D47-like n=1 Tax=Cucurbita pepo subsp. pepo TaxID=3664 RepID=UPI000C9D272E|nr:cytochrome P450 CYP82D47-like [Cucurbita pepo subsp. pepo]
MQFDKDHTTFDGPCRFSLCSNVNKSDINPSKLQTSRPPQMELTHIIPATFALLLFLYALLRITSRRSAAHRTNKRLPPEAAGRLPVIGHLHKLSATEPTHITLAKMADAYGPIFTLKLGMNTVLVVSSWEIARECFTTNDTIFASRSKGLASELLGYNYTLLSVTPYGPYWRHVRKIATHELLANQRLEQLQHIRMSEVRSSIKKLYELNKGSGGKVRVEMGTWFGDVSLNTILRMVVGKRLSSVLEGSGAEQYKEASRDVFELFGAFVPSDSFPFLSWLDLGGYKKAMNKTAKVLDQMLTKWIEEHREKNKNLGEGGVETEEQDFMDVMLSAVSDQGGLGGFDADTVTKATCFAMVLGAYDTTMITMTWALSLLLNNQQALNKAQLELDEKVGTSRRVKESDVKNLPYLQAILKETLRLYPAAPLLIPHESVEDCIVSGYHIPAGTRLLVNVQKLQKNPLVWEDPCEFRPERFLTSDTKFDMRGQNMQLMPFGSGRRMCPGISFALQLMHLTLASLLHEFEINRPSEELLNMDEGFGITVLKKTPLEVVLHPRLPSQVYE